MPENISSPTGRKDLRIVFMGTPEFAVPSLEKLFQAGYNIAGVVTAPDKPAGRGMQLNESAVKKYAGANNLNLMQPEKLKDPGFINELKSLQADLQIIVAFRMLPEIVWSMPPLGTINLHASLLPQYRGAAPINWAIINGETETGLTTFKLQHEIDTGNILLTKKIKIGDAESAGDLLARMKDAGAGLLLATIDGLCNNTIKEITQQNQPSAINTQMPEHLHHAPKIFKETGKIDWSKEVNDIYNLIRGLSPLPGAYTFLNDKIVKIFKAAKEYAMPTSSAGSYETDKKTYLKFACNNGYIHLQELQLEGKKKILIEEFLKGFRP